MRRDSFPFFWYWIAHGPFFFWGRNETIRDQINHKWKYSLNTNIQFMDGHKNSKKKCFFSFCPRVYCIIIHTFIDYYYSSATLHDYVSWILLYLFYLFRWIVYCSLLLLLFFNILLFSPLISFHSLFSSSIFGLRNWPMLIISTFYVWFGCFNISFYTLTPFHSQFSSAVMFDYFQ